MATLRSPEAAAVSRPVGRIGRWRALAAAPAVIGSLLILVVLFGWLGRWEGLVLLGWLTAAAIVFTPAGERIALRVGCGFRRPSAAQAAALASPWAAALRQTGTEAAEVELYVRRCPQRNAYAAGGRSVAVTSGVLQEYRAGRLTEQQIVAVLAHELGHHATQAMRAGLVAAWLTAPWRAATRLVLGLAQALAGRQPRALLALVVCAGVVVAVAQAMAQRNWLTAGLLAGVAALALICPLTDAALARRGEWAADRFAADHGLALPLAAALRALDDDHAVRSWPQRLLAAHPDVDRRIDALLNRQ